MLRSFTVMYFGVDDGVSVVWDDFNPENRS